MIKMVVFDLDGTLVNTLGGIAGACNYVLKNHGYETTPIDEYMNYVGNGLAMTIFRALPEVKKKELLAVSNNEDLQSKSKDQAITNSLDLKHLKGEPNFDVPELKTLIHELLEFYKLNPTIDSHLYEGVEEVLSFLDKHQIKWGIHTNKTASIAKDVADAFIDPTRYLGLKGPNEDIPRKPNPQGSLDLIRVAKDIKLDEVIYVGDTEVDIDTARKLGVPVIAVSYGFRKREILETLNPDYLIDNPLEIIKILNDMIN
jgi:phosphoglycolate phosphatase